MTETIITSPVTTKPKLLDQVRYILRTKDYSNKADGEKEIGILVRKAGGTWNKKRNCGSFHILWR